MTEGKRVYEVYLPSENGNTTTRVAATGPTRAKQAAIYWFTEDPDGELDHINGAVTVTDVTESGLPPYWTVEDDYPPEEKEPSLWTRILNHLNWLGL